MTIESVVEDREGPTAIVIWHDEQGRLQTDQFPMECLKVLHIPVIGVGR